MSVVAFALAAAGCAPSPWVVVGGGSALVTVDGLDGPVEVEVPGAGPDEVRHLARHLEDSASSGVFLRDRTLFVPLEAVEEEVQCEVYEETTFMSDEQTSLVIHDRTVDGRARGMLELCELDTVVWVEWHLDPDTTTPIETDDDYVGF